MSSGSRLYASMNAAGEACVAGLNPCAPTPLADGLTRIVIVLPAAAKPCRVTYAVLPGAPFCALTK